MKKIMIVLALLFFATQLKGQETNQLNDMIVSSINAYFEYDKNIDVDMGRFHNPFGYICKDGLPRDFPYDKLQNVTFFSLDFANSYSNPLKRELKKGIWFLSIHYKLTNKQLRISVTPASAKRSVSGDLKIGVSDGGHYFYEYSCDAQAWELTKCQYGTRMYTSDGLEL